jgi:hypothetical protein
MSTAKHLTVAAMAIPGDNIESMWRNNIDDVSRFLNQFHKGTTSFQDYFFIYFCVRVFLDGGATM